MTVTLEERPAKMRGLKVDERGYPVPWFVAYSEGAPDFRLMDAEKFTRAIKQKLCWVCGNQLGVQKTFVVGPMCGINRTSSEPPSHLECAQYSARNCPFLVQPNMVRREDDLMRSLDHTVAGVGLKRNPGVVLLWTTKEYEVFYDPSHKPLLCMGRPLSVEWYREGRQATRAEVIESVESGLPMLEAVAKTEAGAMEALASARERFERYLPTA